MRIASTASIISIVLSVAGFAQTPASLSFGSANTPCAQMPFGTVTLSGPAPASGTVIALSSSLPATVGVPPSLTVPAGATSARFGATSCATQNQAMLVTITATAGGESRAATLNVLAPVLQSVSFKSINVTTLEGSAMLIGPAPAGGVIVALTSSNSALATLPQSISIPAGSSSGNFAVTNIAPVSQPDTLTITGTALGVAKSASHPLVPATVTAVKFGTTSLATLEGGAKITGQVVLASPAGPAGNIVQLTSSDAAATVTSPVTVASGQTQANFVIETTPIPQTTIATITATTGSVSKTAALTVTLPSAPYPSVAPNELIGGQSGSLKLSTRFPAPAGGLLVHLSSSDPTRAPVPETVVVPAGTTSFSVRLTTARAEQSYAATLTSAVGDDRKTTRVSIAAEGPTALGVSPGSVIGGTSATGRLLALVSDDSFNVQLSSSLPDVATVPASISFVPGETSKSFVVATKPVSTPTVVRIIGTTLFLATKTALFTGTDTRVTRSDDFTVLPPTVAAVTVTPLAIKVGTTGQGKVTLTGPAPENFQVELLHDYASIITTPHIVTVPAGATSVSFNIVVLNLETTGFESIPLTARVPPNGLGKSFTFQTQR